jgi:4-hydroxy-2-oxoheptanedioate aldolase
VVRIPWNDPTWPGRALDAGAEAIVVPMVSTAAQAERAAAACRYAPEGTRSFGPVRAGMLLGSDTAQVNRDVLCLVMIETVEGVENADAICGTPGVDGIYVGPADLATSMGVPLARMFEDPRHAEAVRHVQERCAAHGIIAGIHTNGGRQARTLVEAGYRMCSLATDAALLRQAAGQELALARGTATADGAGAAAEPAASPYGR